MRQSYEDERNAFASTQGIGSLRNCVSESTLAVARTPTLRGAQKAAETGLESDHRHCPEPDTMSTIDRILFRQTLSALGLGLEVACRVSTRFRSQVTRDLSIQISSADGVCHHYVFAPRSVVSRTGPAVAPALALRFASARQGLLSLSSPHAVGKIVHALLEGGADHQGNCVLALWFFPLTRYVLPIGLIRPQRKPLPDSYLEHNPNSAVASRITREPEATELDPDWIDAHRLRAKMAMIRGSAGVAVPMW